jgi:hypothetical protein
VLENGYGYKPPHLSQQLYRENQGLAVSDRCHFGWYMFICKLLTHFAEMFSQVTDMATNHHIYPNSYIVKIIIALNIRRIALLEQKFLLNVSVNRWTTIINGNTNADKTI